MQSSVLRSSASKAFIRVNGKRLGVSGGRQPWDVGRFAKTVAFFNEPPSPQQLLEALLSAPAKALAGLMPGGSSSGSGSAQQVGATGGVGKRVVQQLLAQGRVVRALVRDVDKAKQLLGSLPVAAGGCLQLAAADISQRQTLSPAMFEGVRAVVSCTAVKVQPKEGDTVDRAKYYQGIKFYDPEIVGDTPEAVEYRGLQNVVGMAAQQLGLEQGKVILAADEASAARWGALDDVVMGGVSESSMIFSRDAGEDGGPALVFRGRVSTDNSGGFVSVRCKNFEPLLNLSPYEGLALRVRGNGLRYKCIVRTDTNWDGIGFCRSFDTAPGEWQDVFLPFSEFIPVFRAKTLRDGTRLNPSGVASVQIMLSKFEYDGELNPAFKTGLVELPITSIRGYLKQPVTPRLVHVSSAGVTRPNRPGINVDQEPPAVKLNDALGGLLTYKLAGEDAIRSSGLPFAIVRPCALTEEPAGAPLEIDQGDVIKGKISREEVAGLCISLLQQPGATGTTFEIKSTVPFSQPWAPDTPAAARDWGAELEQAGLKRGVTGKTVDGVYTGKQPEAEALKQKAAAV
ncbi:complex I intermediate-associated protein 30-domain-containing protein [Scenedesmus sp. NREL 46B-D3]|nr:complex I intermediate-associated protein 30-domain-containing protein [Scenedesmus sp. NREL 46B-D3]